MANLYIRSTDGNDLDGGTTWALAKATTMQLVAIDAAGDTLYYSQAHNESAAAQIAVVVNGTLPNPVRIICGNDAAEPPTALATTATVATTGANNILFNGNFYCYGLIWKAGDGTSTAQINCASAVGTTEVQIFEQNQFILPNTSASSNILIGHLTASVPHRVTWKDCQVKFANASQRIQVSGSEFNWTGGSAQSGTTTPTNGLILNAGTGRSGVVTVEGVDLSNFSSSLALVSASGMPGRVIFRNCKLPTSWGGALFNSTPTNFGLRAEMYNCDSAGTNYRLHIEDAAGSIKHETTIVRTGGASDGTTALSWKLASTANCNQYAGRLETNWSSVWNDATGGAKTASVEIVHDSATALKDDEIWLEVQYLGTSGSTQSTLINDCKSDVLATAANQASSSETWTTTGMASPNKQTLSVTFTPQVKGPVLWRVVMAKASKTAYVCPKLTVA